MTKIAVQVKDVRSPQGIGYALAFFTAVIGYEDEGGVFQGLVSVRDCELRETKGGEKYIQYPSKPRIRSNKDGTATYQKDAEDKPIYDRVVDSVMEKSEKTGDDGKAIWFATRASRAFKDLVAAKAAEAYAGISAETQGRGAASKAAAPAKAAAKRPANVAASTGSREVGSPLGGDDPLPF